MTVIERLPQAFPGFLLSQARAVSQLLAASINPTYQTGSFTVQVCGEEIRIPERILITSIPQEAEQLPQPDYRILQCLLTRSTDGFIRQNALRNMLPIDEPCLVPFVIKLVGEYIVEILDDVYRALPAMDRQSLQEFISANPAFYETTKRRVISYWDCYYRNSYRRIDYVGFKILDILDELQKPTGTGSATHIPGLCLPDRGA